MRTPWGESDSRKEYAPGVVFYGTPSHGGIKLDARHNAWMPDQWREDDGWYEEDVDASKVIVAFPEVFAGVFDHREALRSVLYWMDYAARRADNEALTN